MSLDTKNKRGSAVSLGMPHRQWLSEPDGTLDATDRASLLKLCASVSPGAPPAGGASGGVFGGGVLSSRIINVVRAWRG